jgi:hypothetical protein
MHDLAASLPRICSADTEFTRRVPACGEAPGPATRSRRAKAFRNTPPGDADESSAEVVQVLDPRHPLYGRSFRVIRRSICRGGNFPPSVEVEYRQGASLLIPISATEPDLAGPNRTKLSIDALRELVEAAECLKGDECRPKGFLGDAALGSAASDRRRRRRSPGGDLT